MGAIGHQERGLVNQNQIYLHLWQQLASLAKKKRNNAETFFALNLLVFC